MFHTPVSFGIPRRPLLTALAAFFVIIAASAAFAQADDNEQLKRKAAELVAQKKFLEALPILEKLVAAVPDNASLQFDLGSALLVKSITAVTPDEKRSYRLRARAAFIKSQSLGNNTELVRAFISSIPEDGSSGSETSKNPISNAYLAAGENEFAKNNYNKAIELYLKALDADPKNYYAALFVGDSYLQLEDFANAEVWYQKAIAIDPNIETAYRYSATPLMKQKKYDQAKERYIEAWITEPYNRFALNGLLQWGAITNTNLGHPKIEPPNVEFGPDGKSKSTINVNPLAMDGSLAWMAYVSTREVWRTELFRKKFPQSKEYRHSLAEEADALRAVVKMALSLNPKQLDPQIEMIRRLDSENLLEPFILLALADKGIAEDYPDYLRVNRARLREYVNKYVIGTQRK